MSRPVAHLGAFGRQTQRVVSADADPQAEDLISSDDLGHAIVSRIRGELCVVQVRVDAALSQQLVVLSALHDPAVRNNKDLVRAPHR